MRDLYVIGILFQLTVLVVSQRVAPGVNPQHYQQNQQYQQPPQANPQYQQQQQYQQQVHHPQHQQHQQQQPPPQQQQQQQQGFKPQPVPVQHQQAAPAQQAGHGHGHHGGHHGANQPILSGNVQAEKEHIAEHMEVPMDTSKMTEQELQFHYFKMHDADNNNKLDGCELIKSLIHWHDEKDAENLEITFLGDDELIAGVDAAFEQFDKDDDGYITYYEYKREAAEQKMVDDPAAATAVPVKPTATQPTPKPTYVKPGIQVNTVKVK